VGVEEQDGPASVVVNRRGQGQPVALGGSSVCEASNMNRYKTILKGEK
jgi:hypothetical protein